MSEKRQVKLPFFEIGPKSYLFGDDILELAKIADRASEKYGVEFSCVPIENVANKVKYVPREWINEAGNDVLPEALAYIQPLIQGEPSVLTENGLARHFIIV